MYLSQGSELLNKDDLENKPQSIKLTQELLFVPLEDHFYDESRIRAEFSTKNKVDEAFVIEMVSQEEKTDVLFLRSYVREFMKLSRLFKQNKGNEIHNQVLVDMEYLLKRTICFLFDVDYDQEIDYSEFDFSSTPIVERRQRLLKDFNFLELFIDLIHYPFTLTVPVTKDFTLSGISKKNRAQKKKMSSKLGVLTKSAKKLVNETLKPMYAIESVHTILFLPSLLKYTYLTLKYGIQEYRPSELSSS